MSASTTVCTPVYLLLILVVVYVCMHVQVAQEYKLVNEELPGVNHIPVVDWCVFLPVPIVLDDFGLVS